MANDTKGITEPDEPEIPEYPKGESVTQAQSETYDHLIVRYKVNQRPYDRKKQQYDKPAEKHAELVAILRQSITDNIGIGKASVVADQLTTLVLKVKELLRIDNERTI